MSEKLVTQQNPLSPQEVSSFATEFHAQISASAETIIGHGKHRQISPSQIILGDNKNFVNIMGIGTDEIHLVVGKTPVSHHSLTHLHLDIAHLLGHKELEVGESEDHDAENDPAAFDSWEAVVAIGEKPRVTYASHAWKTGTKTEEGKEKKAVVLTSPSGGIMDDSHEAVVGIQNLLEYI